MQPICNPEMAPVCGNDGQTYNNECLLMAERECHPEKNLVIEHEGECQYDEQGSFLKFNCTLCKPCWVPKITMGFNVTLKKVK